jgi:hypothetical protein
MKNRPDDIAPMLDAITQLVISFEPGDVMTVSEIISSLEKISAVLTERSFEQDICKKLLNTAHQEMTVSSENFTTVLSSGIDLLRDAAETADELPPWKQKRIQTWLTSAAERKPIVPQRTEKKELPGHGTESPVSESGKNDLSVSFPVENFSQIDLDQLTLFVSDCEGRFARAQELILILENGTDNTDSVKELFRIFHTVKGECGFLRLSTMGFLSHNVETLLDLLRSGKVVIAEPIVDFLFQGLDLEQKLLQYLKVGCKKICGRPVSVY